jgi:hypothetical protein
MLTKLSPATDSSYPRPTRALGRSTIRSIQRMNCLTDIFCSRAKKCSESLGGPNHSNVQKLEG